MPANLPPQYFEVEKKYRLAKGSQEKIKALEAMLSIIPQHKGTDRLRGQLRRKLSLLKEEAQRRHELSRKGYVYNLEKEGAGQVILVGLPNVGKSKIVSTFTNASPDVADYPFTTSSPIPGMMRFENVQIQLVDFPPLMEEFGKLGLVDLLRRANALLLIIDLGDDPIEQMGTIIQEMDRYRIVPIGKASEGIPEEKAVQKKVLIVGNKNDLEEAKENYELLEIEYGEKFPLVSISAKERTNLEKFRKEVFDLLDVIRVYSKAPGKEADVREPFILKRGSTIEDVAEHIHKDFIKKLKYGRIWGSGMFGGQRVNKDYVLEDGDIVELHI